MARLFLFSVFMSCFLLAAVTDAAYAASAYLMWMHFSQWLIAVGIAFGVLALVAVIFHHFSRHPVDRSAHGAAYAWLLCIALVVGIVNAFTHTADGWTAVMPGGIVLSIVGAILAIAAAGSLWRVPVIWAGSLRA